MKRLNRSALLLALLLIAAPCAFADPTPRAATQSSPWLFVSTGFAPTETGMPYVGNGYFSQRIPPAGAGYLAGVGRTNWPIDAVRGVQSLLAGFYASGKFSNFYPDETKRVPALLPTWSSLDFASPSGQYTASTAKLTDIDGYRQVQDLRTGQITTSGTWKAPGGETTAFQYRVFTSRARKHVGIVELRLTPNWNGTLKVTGWFDGAGAARLAAGNAQVDTRAHRTTLTASTAGTRLGLVMTSILRLQGDATMTGEATATGKPLSGGERVSVAAKTGQTYTFTKYVAVATSKDSPDPATVAATEAQAAASAGGDAVLAESRSAWDKIWQGDIVVDGAPQLQNVVRSGIYNLYASIRDDAPGVLGPSGLSSDSYAGMAFWDSDTWMMPALLAVHPDIARSMVDYRFDTLAAAKKNASANGHMGAYYPWTAADDGSIHEDCYGTRADDNDKILADPNYSCSQEFHLQADVAMAQWNYFAATGDRAWLASKGFPVLAAIADFWTSVATPVANGGFAVNNVQPPDEDHFGVNNSAYTNAAASQAIKHAIAAAGLLGKPVQPRWQEVADGLVKTIPFDAVNQRHLEYDGYDGSTVKQADVVLMTYPLHYPMPAQVALNDINYYVPRTRANGPAMTDAIHSIATSALDLPGCAAYTFMIRSYLPQLHEPFFQTSETTEGGPLNFLTGTGGVLQQFLYGFSGLRFGPDAIELDPSLPPQLQGLTLKGLQWQGRVFAMRITRDKTTVTLASGKAIPVTTRAGKRMLESGTPLVLDTRKPDLQPTDNLARCQATSATSAIAANPPVAAVDGSIATSWMPVAGKGTLNIALGKPAVITSVQLTRGAGETFHYTVDASSDGQTWWPVGSTPVHAAGDVDTITAAGGGKSARFLRVVVDGKAPAHVVEVSVSGGSHP
ncbi:glycosyl hydrolase family 65 protein [Pinirhizobacter sp.]|uniref:glycosyl hydrolase family 65 protein n=1 Tax=Pinirhizobacter sp. TaxID=2950432 RepID=UPI002F405B1F